MLAKIALHFLVFELKALFTGNYFSEALILASTNPQFDDRLFVELQVQYIHEHCKLRTCCVHKLFLFWHSEQFMYTTCSEHAIFMYWTSNSMNNLSSYCGLVDAKIRASDKYLPVPKHRSSEKILGEYLVFLVWYYKKGLAK